MTIVTRTGQSLLHEQLTHVIIAAFYAVANRLGYGFLESVYQNALVVELQQRGITVRREFPVEVIYEGVAVGTFRADLVCEGSVLIEVKSGPQLPNAAFGQVMNYLRATNLPVGLLLHFGPKASFRRIFNGESA